MPYDFEPKQRRFTFNGRPVSRTEIRAEIEKLITYTQDQSAKIAGKYTEGAINLSEFQLQMRELLKSAHIIAASVGRGGRARMTQADWGRVGQKIAWQSSYLAKFARKLATGKLEKAYSAHRAKSYASAIYISYSSSRQETQTEDIIDGNGRTVGASDITCRLIQNSQEGCVECNADADEGWMPVDEMGEIGSRLCGDFCLCEIEFSDEVDE